MLAQSIKGLTFLSIETLAHGKFPFIAHFFGLKDPSVFKLLQDHLTRNSILESHGTSFPIYPRYHGIGHHIHRILRALHLERHLGKVRYHNQTTIDGELPKLFLTRSVTLKVKVLHSPHMNQLFAHHLQHHPAGLVHTVVIATHINIHYHPSVSAVIPLIAAY